MQRAALVARWDTGDCRGRVQGNEVRNRGYALSLWGVEKQAVLRRGACGDQVPGIVDLADVGESRQLLPV